MGFNSGFKGLKKNNGIRKRKRIRRVDEGGHLYEKEKKFSLLRGPACPSDSSVRVKSVQRILNIDLCHLLEGNQYFM